MTANPRKRSSWWTPEREAELERRWKAGESQSQIAEAMGQSRSGVAGIITRRGLREKVERAKAPAFAFSKEEDAIIRTMAERGCTRDEICAGLVKAGYRNRHPHQIGRRRKALGLSLEPINARRAEKARSGYHPMTDEEKATRKAARVKRRHIGPPPPETPSLNLHLHELGHRQCKFATTPHDTHDHRFCGAPTALMDSYCEFHMRVAFLPLKKDKLGGLAELAPARSMATILNHTWGGYLR